MLCNTDGVHQNNVSHGALAKSEAGGEAFVIDNVRIWLGDKVTLQQCHFRSTSVSRFKSQSRIGDKVSDLADGRCSEDS